MQKERHIDTWRFISGCANHATRIWSQHELSLIFRKRTLDIALFAVQGTFLLCVSDRKRNRMNWFELWILDHYTKNGIEASFCSFLQLNQPKLHTSAHHIVTAETCFPWADRRTLVFWRWLILIKLHNILTSILPILGFKGGTDRIETGRCRRLSTQLGCVLMCVSINSS